MTVMLIMSIYANYHYYTKYQELKNKTKKHCNNIHNKVGDIANNVPSDVRQALYGINEETRDMFRDGRLSGPIFSEYTADCKEALESYCRTKVKLMPEIYGEEGDSPMVKEDACKRAEVALCKTIQPSAFVRCAESTTRKELETCNDDMGDYRRISYSLF